MVQHEDYFEQLRGFEISLNRVASYSEWDRGASVQDIIQRLWEQKKDSRIRRRNKDVKLHAEGNRSLRRRFAFNISFVIVPSAEKVAAFFDKFAEGPHLDDLSLGHANNLVKKRNEI